MNYLKYANTEHSNHDLDLSDLMFYESEFDADATIDVGDVINIQCTNDIYRTGQVYAWGKTYVRIIDGRSVYTAKVDSYDVTIMLRLSHNQTMEEITAYAEQIQAEVF